MDAILGSLDTGRAKRADEVSKKGLRTVSTVATTRRQVQLLDFCLWRNNPFAGGYKSPPFFISDAMASGLYHFQSDNRQDGAPRLVISPTKD